MATAQLIGPEFLINTATARNQSDVSVARLANGGFVAVWSSDRPYGSVGYPDILAQRFDATGAKIGGYFVVNNDAVGANGLPAVEGLAGGGFVVSWHTRSVGTYEEGVSAQIYDASGAEVRGEFVLGTEGARGTQNYPQLQALAGGGFVASWIHVSSSGDEPLVKVQIYSATGAAVGPTLTMNEAGSTRTATFSEAALTTLANGNFVVSWEGFTTASGENASNVKAQIFTPAGERVGKEILVDPDISEGHGDPSIAALADGGFVATWIERDDFYYAVRAQLFSADGTSVGEEIPVTSLAQHTTDPEATGLSSGGFVVSWTQLGSGLGSWSAEVGVRVFDAQGQPTGAQLKANTQTDAYQGYQDIISLPDDRFLVSWTDFSEKGDGSGSSVKGQLFSLSRTLTKEVVIYSESGAEAVAASIQENVQDVTVVMASNHGAGRPITYSIGSGEDAALFTVDPTNGLLSFKAAPDFSAPQDSGQDNIYEVTVVASDTITSDSQAFTITITDVPDGPAPGLYAGSAGNDSFAAPTDGIWQISGLGGDDNLAGRNGDDTISGGTGKDLLSGGAGADIFVFAPQDSKAGGGVRDVISDFEVGVDKLDLTALNITDFAAQVSYKTVGSGLIVYVDTDRDGFEWSDFGVQLTGVWAVGQSDFLL